MRLDILRNGKHWIILPALVAAIGVAFPPAGSTHEPITTKVMFNKEVIRILQRNCLGCHSPGHIKADVSLTTYEEARPWAKAIKEEVLEKRMMPFQAVKGYGEFSHDYTLPQRDVELLVSWIEGGAPRGDEKDYPREAIEVLIKGGSWLLGKPDIVIQPPAESKIAAEGDDESRCVSLMTGLKENRWASAIEFSPGNGTVVRGASLYLERPAPARGVNPARSKCGIPANALLLAEWVPGSQPTSLSRGYGYLLPAGSKLLMKVDYRKSGEATTDLSRFGIHFSKEPVTKAIQGIALRSEATLIPANAEMQRVRATMVVSEDAEAVAIRPVLFPFARSVEATAIRPDGSKEVLVWARNYKFDWQPQYFYKRPVDLPKGTRIEVSAYLDNSDANKNNPNDPSKPHRFSDTLCQISLATAAPAQAPARQARR